MATYLLLYRTEPTDHVPMSGATPEQREAGMALWEQWFAKAGDAVLVPGHPTYGGDGTVGGYSVVRAGSRDAVDRLLEGHPFLQVGRIDVYDCLEMPPA